MNFLRRWPSHSKAIAAAVVAVFLLVLGLLFSSIGHRSFDGLRITGTTRFQDQVVAALVLIRVNSPEAYGIVTNYVRAIKQARRSGMRSDWTVPTFELADPTAFFSVTWCAGSIAHDSMHSKIYQDHVQGLAGPPLAVTWASQVEEEKKCLQHQVEVLRAIGAPFSEVSYCANQDGTHADVNKDGKYDWDDYNQGNW